MSGEEREFLLLKIYTFSAYILQ